MSITFNPYYQFFRRFIFKNNDRQFRKYCDKLENEIEDLFCIIDRRGNTKFIEERSKEILGYSVSKRHKYIFYEVYGSLIQKFFKRNINSTDINSAYVEFSIKDSNKNYLWLRLNFSSVFVNDELLITVIAKDVTIKRALLEEFGENNVWSKSIVENIKLGIVMEDEDRNILSVNQKFMEIFKFNADANSISGANCSEVVGSMKDLFLEPDTFVQSTNKVINEKKEVIDEIFKLKNGQVIERSFFHFKSNLGETLYFWIFNDVTEYYKLLDLLTEKEARYRGILENTQLGILEVDYNLIITNVSSAFCTMSGYEESELVGVKLTPGFLIDDSTIKYCTNLVDMFTRDSLQKNVAEFQLLTRDGSKLWVLVSTAPSFNGKNETYGCTSFFYDITERKMLEESLRAAIISSKKSEESEKLFIANMTHELKTPINAILGMGDLLKLTTLDEEQTEYVDILDTSTKYLQKLVSDVLDMSKIESGFIELSKVPFNLKDLLLEIAHSFDYSLAKTNIHLKIKLDFRPNLEILGDKTILQQIINNLLSNAEKFTEKGSILLSVEQIEESIDSISLQFMVKDTGIGFDENLKDLIFEKFTQLPSMNQHKSPGTGLGLNIVKQLLAFKGSKIELTSKIGEGSEFSFKLTFQKNKCISQATIQPKKRNFINPFNGIKILVVEDNELNLQYLSKVLKKWSVNFDIAKSGESALAQFEQKEYNLVLLDLQLPGINGFETAIRLRSSFQTQIYTIIAMTAVVTVNIEREILKHGMNDIIKKPFSIDELYDKIALFFISDDITKEVIPFYNSLDTKFLNEFYDDDYTFALSVFKTFRSNYLSEFKEIINNSHKIPQNEIDFRLHNMLPSFKMVGMTDIEKEIRQYITNEAIDRGDLLAIFTPVKIANIEMILDKQILIMDKLNYGSVLNPIK